MFLLLTLGLRPGRTLTVLSCALTVAASGAWLVIPAYSSGATLIEVNGTRTVRLLVFPVIVTLAPLLIPYRATRIAAAIILALFAFISSFSIGLFYYPSVAAMFAASVKERLPVPGDHSSL
jgi:hypothetical protein